MHKSAINPLRGWQLDLAAVSMHGQGLQHPECVVAERDGSLWVADARGIVRIGVDGRQRLLERRPEAPPRWKDAEPSLPNGIALASNRDLLIANIGTGALERMSGDGTTRVLFDSIDGKPIGKVNFVLRDSMDRLWISVSTRVNPVADAVRPGLADGYIALADDRGIRVVADGFHFANEVRFDAREEWLYVVETTAQRISRLRTGIDGTLSDREIFGPSSLAPGFPDGISFDSAGNLWCAIAMADRLVALTPQGDVLTLCEDGDPAAARVMDVHFNEGSMTGDLMIRAAGKLAPGMASIAFGGSEMRTVFIGSSMGTSIPSFTSPVAGLPLAHQREG